MEAKKEELDTNSKIISIRNWYRNINDFKKGYQPTTNIVNDEKGDLVAKFPKYVGQEEEIFLPTIELHGVNDIRHTEIHTAEPLVFEPSAFEFELAITKLKVTNHRVLIKFEQN